MAAGQMTVHVCGKECGFAGRQLKLGRVLANVGATVKPVTRLARRAQSTNNNVLRRRSEQLDAARRAQWTNVESGDVNPFGGCQLVRYPHSDHRGTGAGDGRGDSALA